MLSFIWRLRFHQTSLDELVKNITHLLALASLILTARSLPQFSLLNQANPFIPMSLLVARLIL